MSEDVDSAAARQGAAGSWQRTTAILFSRPVRIALVVLVFAATRFWFLQGFEAIGSDAQLYGHLSRLGVDCGQTAYRDFQFEYPPLAWWFMSAPCRADSDQYSDVDLVQPMRGQYMVGYLAAFHRQMLLADMLCLAMLFLVEGLIRRAPAWAFGALPLAYTVITIAQPHLLFERLDIVLLLFLLLAVYCWLRSLQTSTASDGWAVASYLLLGLGFSFKIMPILLAPPLLLADWRAVKSWGGWAGRLAALTAGAAGPFLIQMLWAGSSVFDLFHYHSEREIHLESIWGSLLLGLRQFGIPCQISHAYGGFNLIGPWQPTVKIAAIAAAVALAVGLGLWAILRGRRFDPQSALDCGYLMLVNSTVLSTVFSPQYLNWLLPISLLLALDVLPRRGAVWLLLVVLMATILAISSWLFPHHYMGDTGLVGLAAVPVGMVEIRSVCLVALAILLNVCFFMSASSVAVLAPAGAPAAAAGQNRNRPTGRRAGRRR